MWPLTVDAVMCAGVPPVAAPLADPNAQPSDTVGPAVDVVLRSVVAALLLGPDDPQAAASLDAAASSLDPAAKEPVQACLHYLRDRVGVPRDMQLPAARQLRAHLNYASGKLA